MDSDKLVLNGITAVITPMGDIKLTIHPQLLHSSLHTFTTNLRNGTILAVASKRLLPSQKGHTHQKPLVIQATCKQE